MPTSAEISDRLAGAAELDECVCVCVCLMRDQHTHRNMHQRNTLPLLVLCVLFKLNPELTALSDNVTLVATMHTDHTSTIVATTTAATACGLFKIFTLAVQSPGGWLFATSTVK